MLQSRWEEWAFEIFRSLTMQCWQSRNGAFSTIRTCCCTRSLVANTFQMEISLMLSSTPSAPMLGGASCKHERSSREGLYVELEMDRELIFGIIGGCRS